MAVSLTIGGVDKTSLVDWSSLIKRETLTKSPATLDFSIRNYPSKTYRPTFNQEVKLYNGATLIYGGYVVQTKEQVNGLLKYFSVSCTDYNFDLDRQLVTEIYTAQTVNFIIADIISKYLPGFTGTNVSCATVIDFVQFNYTTVSQCLKTLISRLGNFDFYVDYAKDIHFFANTTIAAPFSLTDTSDNFMWNTLQLNADVAGIKNTIIIQGGLVPLATTRNYQFNGDATKTSFVLGDTLSGTPTVAVSSIAQTVGIDGTDSDASFQVMWSAANNSIRFTAGNTPGSGTNNIIVTGYPLYPLVSIFENNASVLLYGVHQFLIQDKTIVTQDAANARASAEILRYGNPTYSGSFRTKTDGLKVGMTIPVSSTIRSITSSFKVSSMRTTMYEPTAAFMYEVEFVTADDIGINDVLNKLLILDPAANAGVPTNTVIQVIKQIGEGLTITDAVSFLADQNSGAYKWNAFTWGFASWNA